VNKVPRLDESNFSSQICVSSRESSVCSLASSVSSRGRGRPSKNRKGGGRPKKKINLNEIIPDEGVFINENDVVFIAPDPPICSSEENPPVRRSSRISSRSMTSTISKIEHVNDNAISISSYCTLKHKGIPCADIRAKHVAEFYDSGDLGAFVCHYCCALLLESEVNLKHKSKFKVVSSSFCCSCGGVKLPPYREHPKILKDLLKNNNKESKDFISSLNNYNSLLAFASISVLHENSSLDGAISLLLNGEFVRKISSMFSGNLTPSFSQLYILDANEALNLRTQNSDYCGDRVNHEILRKLDTLLREMHPFAKEYKNFHNQYKTILERDGPDSVSKFRFTLLEERLAPSAIKDKSLHTRQVNLPEEKSMFSIWTESNEPPKMRGIYITDLKGCLFELPAYHPMTDTLCYPLLFPCGDDGFHKNYPFYRISDKPANNIESSSNESFESTEENVDESTQKKFISIRDYIRYRLAIRQNEDLHNIWNAGGGLGQKFVLDYATRIDAEVADFLRKPELNLRSSLPENVLQHLAKDANLSSVDQLGSVVMFRKNNPGTRPYFQDMFYDATTIMARTRKTGCASFMFTFTTNPRWPEISRNFLRKDQKLVDRFDIICRIYEDKLRKLHYLLDKKKIFGNILGYAESREFQKRIGGPHLHRVFCTDTEATSENIDNLIWAHIPKKPDDSDMSDWANFIRKVRELLPKYQLHSCGEHCKSPNGRCLKGFPKPFNKHTILYDNRPAEYYRPSPDDGGETISVKNFKYDNSNVVPFNPLVLVMFQSHHNLEYAYGQSDNLKYALKYPFKGASFSYIKCTNNTVNVDEPAQYARMLYRSPSEAYCRIMSYKYAFLSHTVIPLTIHLPGKQKIYFAPATSKLKLRKVSQAARLRGLFEDNSVWEKTLREASFSFKPSQMRQLFVNILVFGSTETCIIDALKLWEMFIDGMFDHRCSDAERPHRIDRALSIIEKYLLANGKQMNDFNLPLPR
ncbi:ATP-dependent DNA helicase, partial [Meloidogyne graminicola]